MSLPVAVPDAVVVIVVVVAVVVVVVVVVVGIFMLYCAWPPSSTYNLLLNIVSLPLNSIRGLAVQC